ncbi:uncharacterized protein LOC143558590 [Bidens hawaiensis]|uniref:uncharacterized protein LOC143558590 n=1 Tax=Bidens hawaiensis TaxID=980011 RepID=UPI004048EC8D
MRLTVGSKDLNIEETRLFAEWLLKIGEGKLGGPNHGEVHIDIPHDILIKDSVDPTSALIEFVYPSILQNYTKKDFFQERAILAPKNEVVQEINDMLLATFPGEHKEYLSFDSIDKSESVNEDFDPGLYSPEFSMVIEIEAVSGSEIGKGHAIHRVTLNPSDKKFPFKFNRRKFPLSVCFGRLTRAKGNLFPGLVCSSDVLFFPMDDYMLRYPG